jgi:hypothetical protein
MILLLSFAIWGCAEPRPLSVSRRTPTIATTTDTIRTPPAITPVATANNAFAQHPTPTTESSTDTLPATALIPTPERTATPAVMIVPATPSFIGSEQRWRAQQQQRSVFDPPKFYEARSPITLFWYDPATGQVLEIGTLRGIFPAQAQFIFRPTNTVSLEVPYRINGDFGLTSISDAVLERMSDSGYTTTVEAFVSLSESIVPKP